MFEILSILSFIYLLYRIVYYYKKVDYSKVKDFVSILIFLKLQYEIEHSVNP